jgi:hypothetical protein
MTLNTICSSLIGLLNKDVHVYQVVSFLFVKTLSKKTRQIFSGFFSLVACVVVMYYKCRGRCREAKRRFMQDQPDFRDKYG